MWTRQELKAKGKEAFKANYWPNVLAAFLLMLLSTGTSVATRSQTSDQNMQNQLNGIPEDQKALVVLTVIGTLSMIIIVSVLLDIFLFNPLKIGCYAFFKTNVQDNGRAELGLLKEGFSDYGHKFITMFISSLFIALGAICFIIPGVVLALSYRMVPFIVRDNPELSPMEVLKKSSEMMKGHKWNAFVLDLSFIGWDLLAAVTLGLVGLFWSNPYQYNTNAALYLRLSGQE
jgi:uncharacterized membrane protein